MFCFISLKKHFSLKWSFGQKLVSASSMHMLRILGKFRGVVFKIKLVILDAFTSWILNWSSFKWIVFIVPQRPSNQIRVS